MRELQQKVKLFIEKNNLQMKPEFYALDIVSEMGEVAKEILKIYDYGRSSPQFRKDLKSELGDLLYSLIALANHYDIDLEQELDKSINKYQKRIVQNKTPGSGN